MPNGNRIPSWLRLWPTTREWAAWGFLERCCYIGVILTLIGIVIGVIPLLPSLPEKARELAPEEKFLATALLPDSEALPGLTPQETQWIRSAVSNPATIGHAHLLLTEMRARPHTRQGIESIDGLMIAAYYGQKQYRAGLEYLCKITADLPRDDFRYRFQFHALVRAIAASDGRAMAEQTLDELRHIIDRPELSRVWVGIPLRMMEALHDGRLAEEDNFDLPDSDRAYLTLLVGHSPTAPFIDYAQYFLHNYREAITGFPRSQIRDLALRAEAARASDCTVAATCDPAIVNVDLAEVATIDPNNYLQTVHLCRKHLAKSGKLRDAFQVSSVVCDKDCIESIVESASYGPTSLEEVLAWLGETSPQLLRDDWFEPRIRSFDRSSRLIESGDYPAAAALIDTYAHKLRRWNLHMPLRMANTLATIQKLAILARQPGPEAMFNLGLAEIDVGKTSDDYSLPWQKNAIRTFEHLELTYPASGYAPRACYLRAATYRHMQNYGDAIAVVDVFLKRYPTSPLADDMLAERGVHELLVNDNWSRARSTFDEVIRRFPRANASDNALNWIAWYRLKDCDYAGAYETYQRLAAAYPANRLGIRAMAQMIRIHHAVESRRIHIGVPGLRLSREGEPGIESVESGSVAEHVGFTQGATIAAVNGVPVYTAEAFYALLQHMIPNRVINVALADTAKVLQTPLQPVAYYAETYDSLHAAPFNHSRCGL